MGEYVRQVVSVNERPCDKDVKNRLAVFGKELILKKRNRTNELPEPPSEGRGKMRGGVSESHLVGSQ